MIITNEIIRQRVADRLKLRADLANRDGYICHWCEVPLMKKNESIDHLKPLSKKGESWVRENCVLACKACNNFRGNMSAEKFRSFINRIVRSPAAKKQWREVGE